MITIDVVTVRCDWPGCLAHFEAKPDVNRIDRLPSFVGRVANQIGWQFQIRIPGSIDSYDDYCPKHGRCKFCLNRLERTMLENGRCERCRP